MRIRSISREEHMHKVFFPKLSTAALFVAVTLQPLAANPREMYDDRPILVRPATHISRGDCPTCYKGHDFGNDCFQFVWNGLENIWTNVCLLGWH
jgi:hypothetical protein